MIVETVKIKSKLDIVGIPIWRLLINHSLSVAHGEAVRLMQGNGISINGQKLIPSSMDRRFLDSIVIKESDFIENELLLMVGTRRGVRFEATK